MKIRFFIFFIIFLSLCNFAEAYSTKEYSINIANTYSKVSEGSFLNENGDNINIKITPFPGKSGNPYTKENLNQIVNNLQEEINNNKDLIIKNLKTQSKEYGLDITENDIENYVKSIKIDSIDKKEITTVTKNKYKCFHIISKISTESFTTFLEQYSILSGNNIYTISVGTNTKSNLNSNEIKNMIDSFTIFNYKNPSFFSEKFWVKTIASGILVLISSLWGISKRKHNNNKSETLEYESSIDDISKFKDQNIEIEENEISNDYCTKCGKKINNNWKFCNYCGNKLK